jgi:hypothetical protein
VIADQHHRQVDQPGGADSHAESRHEQPGERRSERGRDAEGPERREAGHEHSPASEPIGQHPHRRRHEDARERGGGDQQAGPTVADTELVEDVGDRGRQQGVAHDPRAGDRQDQREQSSPAGHRR